MPTVPVYNNGNLASTPNISPAAGLDLGISPEGATVGARQLTQLGDTITQAGKQQAAIEVDALQQANQLRVDDSLNQLKESSLKLRYDPQAGFENVKGIDALQRQSGKSLMDDYGELLQTRSSDIENSLSNDAQKIAFRKNANNIITGFKGDVEQHESAQFQGYALSVREGTIKNRITEIGLNYNNPEVVANAVNSIRAATYDQGRLLGKSAEWSEAQARESTSNAHKTAVLTALQKNDPTYADAYLKKHSGEMTPDDILQVNGTLTKQLDGQIGLGTATSVMQEMAPKIQTSDSDRAFNIALGSESNYKQFDKDGKPLTSSAGAIGIAQVMPGTAPEAAKLAGLPWDEEKYKNDPTYNRALGKAYFDKQLKDFHGNLALAYAAYNAGPQRLKDVIEKDATMNVTYNADGTQTTSYTGDIPPDWLSKMPKETQDYVTKNMKAYGNGAGQYDKPTLLDVQAAIRAKTSTGNPERLKIALDEGERQYNATLAAVKQKNEEAKANAMRGVMDNGGRFTDLPANVRGSLAPEDVTGVMDFAKKISSGDNTTSLWLYNKLTTNPQELKSMTDDQFFALRSELSIEDFKHFSDERGKLISGTAPNSPGDMNTDAITRTLNDRLNSMGIDPTPKDATDDAERVGAVRRFVNQSIAVEQANRGKKMSDVEVSGFIDSLLSQQSNVFSSTFFGSPRIAKTGDIPSATKDALKEAFKRKGITDPSDTDILNAYWRQVSLMQKQKPKAKTNG